MKPCCAWRSRSACGSLSRLRDVGRTRRREGSPDEDAGVSPLLGISYGEPKPLPEDWLLLREIRSAYERLDEKLKRGETEALALALRYSVERRGNCGHGRENKRDDSVLGFLCPCEPAEYVAVPRWLLAAARATAEDALARESEGRGQHSKLTDRFRSQLRDVETFRLVESMRRGGKSLQAACESGGRGVSDQTIRAAHRRVAGSPERYRRALEWAISLPRFRYRESHFPRRRAEAIFRLYGDMFEWILERALPWSPFTKPNLPSVKPRRKSTR